MRTDIPEKLIKITEEIEDTGQARLTRLTVLKKWFAYPALDQLSHQNENPQAMFFSSRSIVSRVHEAIDSVFQSNSSLK